MINCSRQFCGEGTEGQKSLMFIQSLCFESHCIWFFFFCCGKKDYELWLWKKAMVRVLCIRDFVALSDIWWIISILTKKKKKYHVLPICDTDVVR